MTTKASVSSILSALLVASSLFCVSAGQMVAQTAGQDMQNAGTSTKNAAKDTGHAVKKTSKKATANTKSGTGKAYDKTKEGGQ